MRHPRLLLAALLLPILATALIACGGGDADEPQLTVYSGRNEALVGPLLERFSEQTGIETDVRYGDTAELAATLREEGDRSPADVYFAQDGGALGAVEKEGLFAELPQATLRQVDERFRSAGGDWVGASGRARVIAYDDRVLDSGDLPGSVFDLVDERWRGKVGWAPTNGSFQAFVTAMRAVHGDERAEQWLRDMKDNDAQVYDNNILVRDAIAAGEVEAGLINHYYVIRSQREDPDYPVALHFPDGDVGALVNVAGVGVLASSEHPREAQELVGFLLSPEAQEYFREETTEYPLAAGVEPLPALPALASIEQPNVDLADIDDLQGTLELLERAGVL